MCSISIVYTVYKTKNENMNEETFEFIAPSGKRLKVTFIRLIDEKRNEWMKVTDAFSVEEI
jgi:hypothetical protein